MDDDVPTINVSREPCGSVGNPHVVRSPTALLCDNCGAGLSGVLLDRLRVALVRTEATDV